MSDTLFTCPACGGTLIHTGSALLCPKGHSYDLARQGYVHLLKPNQMHAKIPGDNKQMVDARRNFLEKGYYNPFSAKLTELCTALITEESPVILDAGCGEGYYTAAIKAACPQARVYGFDISKFAVKAAAGKYKGIHFAVASVFHIPFGDNTADLLVNVFAPMAEGELCRVLKPGGFLILAVPGKRHLFSMKEILYENPYENQEQDTPYEGFQLRERIPVQETITLNRENLWQLFSMTPYYWKTDVTGSENLKNTQELTTEIHFDFLLYQRMKGG